MEISHLTEILELVILAMMTIAGPYLRRLIRSELRPLAARVELLENSRTWPRQEQKEEPPEALEVGS